MNVTTSQLTIRSIINLQLCYYCVLYELFHLESEEVVHSADDDVDGGGAADLRPQVVLKI